MSFHRNHIKNFVAACNFTKEETEAINRRAEEAAIEFSSAEEGNFSGAKLGQVLGRPELVKSFDDMWEQHRSVLDAA